MRIWISAVPAALMALAACAPTPPSSAGGAVSQASRCFQVDRIANFTVDGTTTIYVRSQRGDVYQLNGPGGCPDVDFASALSITPLLGGGDQRLCIGDQARVQPLTFAGSPGAPICRFNVARLLTGEETAALPDRYRP